MFTIDSKIIGARYYLPNEWLISPKDSTSPGDIVGHGTHIASTAAGLATAGSLFEYVMGLLKEGSPQLGLQCTKSMGNWYVNNRPC